MNSLGQIIGNFEAPLLAYPTNSGLQGFLATPVSKPGAEVSLVHIETPSSTSGTISGRYVVNGWAIDNVSGVSTLDLLVDGALVAATIPSLPRPDVCSAYPNQSGCPNVGWQLILDTSGLSDGNHTLQAVDISNTGQKSKTSVPLSVANANLTQGALRLNIESPTSQMVFSGPGTLSGWAEDPGSIISNIGILFDLTARTSLYNTGFAGQISVGNGGSRPDVCAAFPGDLNCPNVGWSYTYDFDQLAPGNHTVTIFASAGNGDQATATQSFTVVNNRSVRIVVDAPTKDGTLSGQPIVPGWALDPNDRIRVVYGVIDGVTDSGI